MTPNPHDAHTSRLGRQSSSNPGARAANGARVLVLWTGYRAGVQTCRALTRAGFAVIGAHPEGAAGGASRWCRNPVRYAAPQRDPEAFFAWLSDFCQTERIDVVLPVDEDIVRLIGRRRPDLWGAVHVGPNERQYHALCDKRQLARTAITARVDHPTTITVTQKGPDGDWPSLPVIIKPVVSRSDMSVARITLATTERERDDQVGQLIDAGLDALVQERIVGTRWVGHCVRDAGGLAIVASRIEHDYPRGTGVACVQRTAAPPPGLVESVSRLLAQVDYQGPATVSFLKRGDRLFVHDVNLRIGASVGLMVRSGFDIPSRSVEAALGIASCTPATWTPTSYVWLDGELDALKAALRGRLIGESPFRIARRIASAVLLPGRMTDPTPTDSWWLRARASRLTLRCRSLVPRLRSRRGSVEDQPVPHARPVAEATGAAEFVEAMRRSGAARGSEGVPEVMRTHPGSPVEQIQRAHSGVAATTIDENAQQPPD